MTKRSPILELIDVESEIGSGDIRYPAWRIAIGWIILPIHSFCLLLYIAPLTMTAISLFWGRPELRSLIGVIFGIFLDYAATMLGWSLASIFSHYDLNVKYLDCSLKGRCKIKMFSLMESVPEYAKLILRASRVASVRDPGSLLYCFIIEPFRGFEFGQLKGFSIPFGGMFKDGRPVSSSCMFVFDPPDDFTPSIWYQVFHEVGHSTKYAWRAKVRFFQDAIVALILVSSMIAFGYSCSNALYIGITYYTIRSTSDYASIVICYGSLEKCRELIADKFALRLLRNNPSLGRIRRSVLSEQIAQARSRSDRIYCKHLIGLFRHAGNDRLRPLDSVWQYSINPLSMIASSLFLLFAVFYYRFHSPSELIHLYYACFAVYVLLALTSCIQGGAAVAHLRRLRMLTGEAPQKIEQQGSVVFSAINFGLECLLESLSPFIFSLGRGGGELGAVNLVLSIIVKIILLGAVFYILIQIPIWMHF